MSGICGWFGQSDSSADQLIHRMTEHLSRLDRSKASSVVAKTCAIGCAGSNSTTALLRHGGHVVAVSGHPRWVRGSSSVSATMEFCRLFVEAFEECGSAALAWVQGDFALGIWDENRNRGLLAIDRIGTRSLTYQMSGDDLIFASTADAMSLYPRVSTGIDPQSIYHYIYFHMVPGPDTIRRDQKRLLPGHFILMQDGRLAVDRYWGMSFLDRGESIKSLQSEFLDSLREGVRTSLDGEKCGAFLSGGTDSSTVSGLIREVSGSQARTFSIGFKAEGYDEMEYARLAAKHFGTDHHEYYVSPEDVCDAIPLVADAYDQPYGNASAVPTYFCAKMARENGVVRMLAGDGGDELFGGNTRYSKQILLAKYQAVPEALRKRVIEPLLLGIPKGDLIPGIQKLRSYIRQATPPMPRRYESYNLLDRLGAFQVFTPEFLKSIDLEGPSRVLNQAHEPYRNCSLIDQMLGIDLKLTLADNDLPKVTRMCELAGIEVAFPMLHESVVGISGRLPERQKIKGSQLRHFFKESLRGFLPDAIISKEKHGFGLPSGVWLHSHAPLNAIARDALGSLKKRGIVRREFMDRLFAEYLPMHPPYYGAMVWVLMMLELWLRRHEGGA